MSMDKGTLHSGDWPSEKYDYSIKGRLQTDMAVERPKGRITRQKCDTLN